MNALTFLIHIHLYVEGKWSFLDKISKQHFLGRVLGHILMTETWLESLFLLYLNSNHLKKEVVSLLE